MATEEPGKVEINRSNYRIREIGWLSFNERVLQEAADPRTPLIERIKFLGIFSSNLDEFFRVRVATLKRMLRAGKKAKTLSDVNPRELLDEIQQTVLDQQNKVIQVYERILVELEKKNIFIVDETQLTEQQERVVRTYFQNVVRPCLFPVLIDRLDRLPQLNDHSIYLAVRMRKKPDSKSSKSALIEVPTDTISRFFVLPPQQGRQYIILLDDIIRVGLSDVFCQFGYKHFEAYTIKLTRDAELDIEDDLTLSYFEKITKSLKKRDYGVPTRFIYDADIPDRFLRQLVRKTSISSNDTLTPGGRYHNFKDFMDFPSLGGKMLKNDPLPPMSHPGLNPRKSMLKVIRKRDILLHYPYHTFNHFIDLLREASIDPRVVSIKISLYRLARNSNVVNALINAVRNGKDVTVVMELQARFDEKANIYWTDIMREEGIRILYGVPDLKVHSKVLLITRKERGGFHDYVNISTGNYNEATATLYSDHSLCTCDERITGEVAKIFEFFEKNYKTSRYEHLLVSPFYMRKKLYGMISREADAARKGQEACITLKLNHLADKEIVARLYEAAQAGVKIRLMVRGSCAVVAGAEEARGNIEAYSILDRFLEHSRILVFHNGGEQKIYLSSADWMTRNLDKRVEVACPVFDPGIRSEILEYLDMQFRDNTKARIIDGEIVNPYRREPDSPRVRAQVDYYWHQKSNSEREVAEKV